MRDENEILELITSIYEAAVEPTIWPRVVERVAEALGHAAISLTTTENFDKPIDIWLARYDPACMELRFRRYARPDVNPSVRAAMEAEPLRVVPRQQFLTDREFERDPASQAILIAQDLYYGCISTLHRAGPLLSVVEVYRPQRLGDFDRSAISILQRLVPHLAQALRVSRHVSDSQSHQHQVEEALNQLNVGLFVLTDDGRIVFSNRAAEELLHRREGIRLRAGKLAASHHSDTDRLAGVIADVAGAGEEALRRMVQALRIDRSSNHRPLQLWVVPLPRETSSLLDQTSQSDVMVIVIDPELSAAPPIETLKALYQLTEAEARLTCGLLAGDRLEDYAKRAGISMNTARTHLKSVFAKTDTARQAELIRLLSRAVLSHPYGRGTNPLKMLITTLSIPSVQLLERAMSEFWLIVTLCTAPMISSMPYEGQEQILSSDCAEYRVGTPFPSIEDCRLHQIYLHDLPLEPRRLTASLCTARLDRARLQEFPLLSTVLGDHA